MAGRGFPGVIDVGKGGGGSFSFSFSGLAGSGSGSDAGAGVADLAGGLVCLLFAACSARAAARAGSFLFFSIGTASRTGCAQWLLVMRSSKCREKAARGRLALCDWAQLSVEKKGGQILHGRRGNVCRAEKLVKGSWTCWKRVSALKL